MCFMRSSTPAPPPPAPRAPDDTPATAGTMRRQPFQETRPGYSRDATVILDSAAGMPGGTNLLGRTSR